MSGLSINRYRPISADC